MPKQDWSGHTPQFDGQFGSKLPEGVYVAIITGATWNAAKGYADVVFDIYEGEHRGHWDNEWGRSHPYAHHFILSYKEGALDMTMGRLTVIQRSNPGFDAFAAADADKWGLFVGKVIGVDLEEDEFNGKTRLECKGVYTAQDVRDGKVRRWQKGGGAQARHDAPAAPARTIDRTVDIPFD